MIYQNVKLGADPELFLTDAAGKFRSAIGLIGGTKQHPRPIDDDGSAVQEDNVAVEFNVIPANSKEQFRENVMKVLGFLNQHVRQMELKLAVVPSAVFDHDQLDNPAALEFGCDPDWNVYKRNLNDRPEVPKGMEGLRSAGGHIHLSWDNPTRQQAANLIVAMDVFVGAPAIQYDGDQLRRKLYGKAGCFRFKDYGAEYRTPSNFWIKSPDMVEWAYEQSMKAVDFLNSGGVIDEKHYPIIQQAINNNDEGALLQLQQYYPV